MTNVALPDGFWLGLLMIPVVLICTALTLGTIAWLIWMSERVHLGQWKIWPHKTDRVMITATVACATCVKYLWIPGWHIVICRTTNYHAKDDQDILNHRDMQRVVREELKKQEQP